MRSLLALASLVALLAVLAVAPSAPAAAAHRCGRMDTTAGGAEATAIGIRARGVTCRSARKVVRACLRHRVARHWHAAIVADSSAYGTHLLLPSRHRRITFHAAGAGGCISS